jgi:phosphoglycerate kinase
MREIIKLKSTALRGKMVLVRVDFNVPLREGVVADDFRIRATLPLIRHLEKCGARVILISHLEAGGERPNLTPVYEHIRRHFLKDIVFLPGKINEAVVSEARAAKASVILLDNLRLDSGEVNNDKKYARILARAGDLYVNEAFGVSHRNHASIISVPKLLPSFAGPLLVEEVRELNMVMKPKHPFLAILGGNKISTKIPVIKSLLRRADKIFVGGAMANVFFKISGHEVGRSFLDKAGEKYAVHLIKNKKIILPRDVIVEKDGRWFPRMLGEVKKDERIYDLGVLTEKELATEIARAHTVLWNGPLGYVEAGFERGSLVTAKILARSRAKVIVGGGDTVAFVTKHKMAKKFEFVSTGGGAMLDYIANENLPGIKVLEKKAR